MQFDLTPIEYRLIFFLAENAEDVLNRQAILAAVWGDNTNVLDRSVDTYIAALRKKLGAHSAHVKSVHGVGYKFSADADIRSVAS